MSDTLLSAAAWPFSSFQDRRVLVAEDDYILAMDLSEELVSEGATVLRPVPTVAEPLKLLRQEPAPDVAIIDINLQGKRSWPVADALRAEGIPFKFVTGYDAGAIPAAYADVPRAEKPVSIRDLVSTKHK